MAMKPLKNSSWLPRFGIVVVAAVLVELISVVQYRRVRSMLAEEMELRSHTAMQSRVNEIEHVLYPYVIEKLAQGKLAYRPDGVPYLAD